MTEHQHPSIADPSFDGLATLLERNRLTVEGAMAESAARVAELEAENAALRAAIQRVERDAISITLEGYHRCEICGAIAKPWHLIHQPNCTLAAALQLSKPAAVPS